MRRALATGSGRKRSILDHLNPDETRDVLGRLLAARPDLRAEAESIARTYLGEVTCEGIAEEVKEAVSALDITDLHGRAGKHEWGYVEPTEAAWEILQETVGPFVSDIDRRLDLGLETDALEICKGVVLGLYQVEQGEGGELVEWVPDFPVEEAVYAMDTWWKGSRRRPAGTVRDRRAGTARLQELRKFVEESAPGWLDVIQRIVSRRQ